MPTVPSPYAPRNWKPLPVTNVYRKIAKWYEAEWGSSFVPKLSKQARYRRRYSIITWETLGTAADLLNANYPWTVIEQIIQANRYTVSRQLGYWFPETLDAWEGRIKDPNNLKLDVIIERLHTTNPYPSDMRPKLRELGFETTKGQISGKLWRIHQRGKNV